MGPIFSSTPFLIGFPLDARGFAFGGRLVVNPHRSLGGEFQVSQSPSLDSMEGSGATVIAHLKAVARLEDRLKFNVFALAGPGWMHEHTVCCGGHLSEDNRGSLVWDLGGGVEFVPIRRVSVRTDFTDLIQTRTFTMCPASITKASISLWVCCIGGTGGNKLAVFNQRPRDARRPACLRSANRQSIPAKPKNALCVVQMMKPIAYRLVRCNGYRTLLLSLLSGVTTRFLYDGKV